ncbi:MAG TPA: c-type cytochrome [Methylibium sp.]|nr:c-type cytochrome [Methylibium sp.]
MPSFRQRPWAALGLAVALIDSAWAEPAAQALHQRALAATCASCHGSEGRAVEGAGHTALRGLGQDYIVKQMSAFRDGSRPATVMHQLAKGYTAEQIDQLAAYFAAPQ